METKKEIRKRMLAKRSQLPPEDWEKDTRAIADRLTDLDVFQKAKQLLIYVDYRGEVGTKLIMERAFDCGKQVAVPKVEGDRMNFYRIHERAELSPGAYGILEPAGEADHLVIPKEGEADLLIMPGSAFDLTGGRIGYGGGFYDKYLDIYPFLTSVAIAFDLQIVPKIPKEETDKRPDLIVTQTRSIFL